MISVIVEGVVEGVVDELVEGIIAWYKSAGRFAPHVEADGFALGLTQCGTTFPGSSDGGRTD